MVVAGFPIDAEVEVLTHKNDIQNKNVCVDVTRSFVHLFFSALRSIGGQY